MDAAAQSANEGILSLVRALIVLAVGAGAFALFRAGIDYMLSRGNPRNTAGAHESLVAVGKGALCIGAAVLGATALIATFVH